jgi:hypothetical protein
MVNDKWLMMNKETLYLQPRRGDTLLTAGFSLWTWDTCQSKVPQGRHYNTEDI